MMCIKSFGQNFVEKQQQIRNFIFQNKFGCFDIVFAIEYVQIFGYSLTSQCFSRKTDYPIKDRKCITHCSVCFLGNDMECIVIGCNSLTLGYFCQMIFCITNCNPFEVKNLTTG